MNHAKSPCHFLNITWLTHHYHLHQLLTAPTSSAVVHFVQAGTLSHPSHYAPLQSFSYPSLAVITRSASVAAANHGIANLENL